MTSTPSRQNGNGNGKAQPPVLSAIRDLKQIEAETSASDQANRIQAFDQPVILQQPAIWSRAIVYGIVGVTTFVLAWAAIAQIEEAVPAAGKLEPQGKVQEIQAPVGGVVKEILVQDGQQVKQGDVLLRFDQTAAASQVKSLVQIRTSLQQENEFYRAQLTGQGRPSTAEIARLNLPPEVASLTASRSTLIAENRLYQTQLQGTSTNVLTPGERDRLTAIRAESDSRVASAQLDGSQLQQQLSQSQGQLANARQTLAINQRIYNDIQPVVEEGGLARVQLLRQQTEVLNGQSEVDRLSKEVERLTFAIAQSQEKLQNTMALSRTDLLTRMADNEKQISQIDSQLNKALVDNEKQIAQTNSQLSQAQVTLRYQDLRAPSDGVIFDLKPKGNGFVANTSEPVLKIVPDDSLVAVVNIINQDIGFLKLDQDVDVRIDSFPYSEFGDIHGKLVSIGSDALAPTQELPFYHFPAKILLDKQTLMVNGNPVQLQSGMSLSTNIRIRKRSVLSIFIDQFTRKINSLETTR
jgi:hemolysin D